MSDRIAIAMILYNETFKLLSTNKNVYVCVCVWCVCVVCVCVCVLSEIECFVIQF